MNKKIIQSTIFEDEINPFDIKEEVKNNKEKKKNH
jgi:hypothetical protein